MTEGVPTWLRALDIIIGIVMVILGIIVIWAVINPLILLGVAIFQILGIILIIYGLWNLIKAFRATELATSSRALLFIGSILLLVLGGLSFAHPLLAESLIALLFAIGFIIFGIIILVVSLIDKEVKGWVEWVVVILGVFFIIIGALFIFQLQVAAALLYILLAIALLIGGFVRIVFGLSGQFY